MKQGTIGRDYVPTNKGKLMIPELLGPLPLTVVNLGDLEREISKVVLPDNTARSGGVTKPFEFDVTIPLHHILEITALDIWAERCVDPVSLDSYKVGTLIWESHSASMTFSVRLDNLFIVKEKLPGLDMSNDGDMAVAVYTMSCDGFGKVTPIPVP